MTQYSTNSNFSTDSTGTFESASSTTGITGWTWRSNTGSGNFWKGTITTGGAIGSSYLQFGDSGWGNAALMLGMNGPGIIAASTVTDVLCNFTIATLEDDTATVNIMSNLTNNDYYSLTVFGSGQVQLVYWKGTNPQNGVGSQISKGLSAGTQYWARVHVDGSGNWEWRVWGGAVSSEPGTWDATGTDTSETSGYVGPGQVNSHATAGRFDWFSVGTGGDLAPGPPSVVPYSPMNQGGYIVQIPQ